MIPSISMGQTGLRRISGGADDLTVLLLHMDGTDGSATFTDSSAYAHTVTRAGDAQIDTAQSMAGGASALFDGTGDYLSIADAASLEPGSANFTIEGWFRTTTVAAGDRCLVTKRANNSGYSPFMLRLSGNVIDLKASESGSAWKISATGGTVSTGTWYHWALVRNGAFITAYLAGNNVASGSLTDASSSLYANSDALIIGGDTNANYWNGWIDEVRYRKVAVYTGAFTPPTPPFVS